MERLLVHVEGQTEETFVNEILRDHLVSKGFQSVSARIIGNARLRRRRGGIRSWPPVRRDIMNHLMEDSGCVATTMVDFYGLPQTGPDAWPGRAQATFGTAPDKASRVEEALLNDLTNQMSGDFDRRRFVPFVLMHEFEGLLFSDCGAFGRAIGWPDLESDFQEVRNGFPTPEDINDSPQTHPSKRVEALVPGYEKPLFGILGALEIGLAKLRAECPHFNHWMERLELLTQ